MRNCWGIRGHEACHHVGMVCVCHELCQPLGMLIDALTRGDWHGACLLYRVSRATLAWHAACYACTRDPLLSATWEAPATAVATERLPLCYITTPERMARCHTVDAALTYQIWYCITLATLAGEG